MSIQFTVGICTYNGEKYLPRLLEKLLELSQENNQEIKWEIIAIDNNSNDNTAKIIQEYRQKFQNIELKYYFEPKQGVAYARRRAIKEASSEIIGFLDDDNLPDNNWIINAYTFFKNHEKVGACGSRIHGVYESKPPLGFERIACLLAIVDRGNGAFITPKIMPPGAGLVIRTSAWKQAVPSIPQITGRNGDSIASKGEEIEALQYLKAAGWEIWYNGSMVISHLMSSSRMEISYLAKLCASVGLSKYKTRTVTCNDFEKILLTSIYLINDIKKIIFHLVYYNQQILQPTVAYCELKFLINSAFSPFHHLKAKINYGSINRKTVDSY